MNIADLIKETTASTSTAAITLAGAATGFRSFASGLGVGVASIPVKVGPDSAGAWLEGYYTLTDATTLTRTRIIDSSAAGADVTLATGSKSVSCVVTAAMIRSGMVDPDDAGYDIIAYLGQSNAEGRGDIDSLIEIADARVWQFGSDSRQTARYQQIFVGNDPNYNIYYSGFSGNGLNTGKMSMMTVACKAYADMAPPNRRVLYVPCAVGGTPLVNGAAPWAAGNPGGGLYEAAIAQINAAITAAQLQFPNSRYVGTFWHQGEADAAAGVAKATYVAALKAVIAGVRARVTGAANSWFVIGGMVPEAIVGSGYVNINAAHQQVATETAKCAYVAGVSGYTSDNLHYNAAGNRIMGARLASAVRVALWSTGVAVPASNVTLALSSASTVVGTPVTVTVGTDNALTGSESQSVTLTAPVAGTWSQNPVALNASTPSASPTFTPSAAGSGNITASSSGTPTLAGASIAYTATAAATVPGAPTIGTATAGDSSAVVAGTAPASNGGAAITMYRATSTPGGIAATSATLPVTVTGLTNGTAYTFTLAAQNSVGYGAESAASNSVTPAAAGGGEPVLRARAGSTLVEGGSSPNWTYTGPNPGLTSFDASGAVMDAGLPANGLGSFRYIRQAAPNGNADQFCAAIITGTAPQALAGRIMTILNSSSTGNYAVYVGSGTATVANTVQAAVGDYVRIRRSASTTFIAEVSKDSGATWTTIYTLNGATSGAVNFQLQILKSGSVQGTFGGLVGVGLAAN